MESRGRPRGPDKRKCDREQDRFSGRIVMFDQLAEGRPGHIKIERSRRMMLNPLAEIVVGVFMAVCVGGGQFMMHVLRNGEGRQGHEQEDEADRQASSKTTYDVQSHHSGGRSTTIKRSLSNKPHNQQMFFAYSSIG